MRHLDRRVVLSHHAKDRLCECQLTEQEALIGFTKSFEVDKKMMFDKKFRKYKNKKYNDDSEIHYFRNGYINYTVAKCKDRHIHDDIWLIVTITHMLSGIHNRGVFNDLMLE